MTIPCPCCHGSGISHDPGFGEICTACGGSGELETSEEVWYAASKPNIWEPWEKNYMQWARQRGVYYKHIAETLGRTEEAVYGMKRKLKKRGWNIP